MKKRFLLLLFLSRIILASSQQNSSSAPLASVDTITTSLPLTSASTPLKNELTHADTIFSSCKLLLPACPYTPENAQQGISKQQVSMVIRDGFQGFHTMDEEKKAAFEKKYDVTFAYVGCLITWDPETENIQGYNRVVEGYLDQKFGTSWRKSYNALFE